MRMNRIAAPSNPKSGEPQGIASPGLDASVGVGSEVAVGEGVERMVVGEGWGVSVGLRTGDTVEVFVDC